jgi:hypothetical protein
MVGRGERSSRLSSARTKVPLGIPSENGRNGRRRGFAGLGSGSYPWVNLGGGGWPGQFYAGGEVLFQEQEVVRVRLRAANGTELEDSVEDGIVLFVTDHEVRMPVYAELFDGGGNLVSQHRAMG